MRAPITVRFRGQELKLHFLSDVASVLRYATNRASAVQLELDRFDDDRARWRVRLSRDADWLTRSYWGQTAQEAVNKLEKGTTAEQWPAED
jgi:hypothetical protein